MAEQYVHATRPVRYQFLDNGIVQRQLSNSRGEWEKPVVVKGVRPTIFEGELKKNGFFKERPDGPDA